MSTETIQIAFIGNHQKLRTLYFRFRKLVLDGKIDLSLISDNKKTYLKNFITFNNNWTDDQAQYVYDTIFGLKSDIIINGITLREIKESYKPKITIHNVTSVNNMNYIGFDGDQFVVKFNYNPNLVEKVKEIREGKYNKEKMLWYFPVSKATELSNFAQKYKFTIGDNALRIINGIEDNLEQSYSAERVELDIILKKDLFDFQTVGVDYSHRMLRALIADQMGLGKTPQGIAWSIKNDDFPVLVIVPKALKYNWKNEIEAWTDKKVLIADDKVMRFLPRYVELGMVDFLIINYDGLKKYFVQEIKEDGRGISVKINNYAELFKAVIVDEAHELRNEKNTRYKIAKKVIHAINKRLLLTGTPILNTINDMASMLELLEYIDEFGGRMKFVQKYGPIKKDNFENKNNKNKSESQNNIQLLKELNLKLRSICMIRREKHQVLKELPDKIRSQHYCELSNRAEYDHAYLNLQDFLSSIGTESSKITKAMQAEFIVKLNLLKKLSARGKINDFIEFANNLFQQGEKLVVFAWHKETLDSIKKHFPDMLIISGDVKDEQVNENVKNFQNDKSIRIIGLTYKRGGVGLTLTAASHWACLELSWTDGLQSQAEDRCHRIGQLNTVYCHYFMGQDTVDSYLYDIILKKRELSKFSTGSSEQIEEMAGNSLIMKFKEQFSKDKTN